VEEYRLWVLPAAVGQGAPLFTELARPVTLSLVKTTAFPSGRPRAVLQAGRPRGVTFKIPDWAAPPAHETGLERDAVPGLATTVDHADRAQYLPDRPGSGHSILRTDV
jgi:hypothetical protein